MKLAVWFFSWTFSRTIFILAFLKLFDCDKEKLICEEGSMDEPAATANVGKLPISLLSGAL